MSEARLSSAALLARLGSGPSPHEAARPAQPPIEGLSFAAILDKAATGAISSGRRVEVGRGVPFTPTDSQLDRISRAADAAEASGAVRALVLIDGLAVSVDLATRTIDGVQDAAAPGVISNVDAAVIAAPDSAPSSPAFGPAGTPANARLADVLAGLRERAGGPVGG